MNTLCKTVRDRLVSPFLSSDLSQIHFGSLEQCVKVQLADGSSLLQRAHGLPVLMDLNAVSQFSIKFVNKQFIWPCTVSSR